MVRVSMLASRCCYLRTRSSRFDFFFLTPSSPLSASCQMPNMHKLQSTNAAKNWWKCVWVKFLCTEQRDSFNFPSDEMLNCRRQTLKLCHRQQYCEIFSSIVFSVLRPEKLERKHVSNLKFFLLLIFTWHLLFQRIVSYSIIVCAVCLFRATGELHHSALTSRAP